MQAIRLHPAPSGSAPYTPSNPAPTSALHLDSNLPVPKPSGPSEILIRVKASTIVRDMLTWPEIYQHDYVIPGNDVSGVVVEVFSEKDSKFKPGDEIYGMTHADRGETWAEYTVVKEGEIALKPKALDWSEAAAVPLSAQTAFEALFVHAGVRIPGDDEILANKSMENMKGKEGRKWVLITGAAGGVGVYAVQLARFAGLHVTAATSSNERNSEFLASLGADETIEYADLKAQKDTYDIVIDTVGGEPLMDSWKAVKDDGELITVDSSSWNFVQEHSKQGLRRDGVKALFFIVQGGTRALEALARFAELGILRVLVREVHPLERVREAYERGNGRVTGRGKIVLEI